MASAGDRGEAGDSDDLTCSVCHELFLLPKLLPCGHLLCRHCLLGWMTSHHDALCPLCRCAIVEAEEGGGGRWEEVADALPTDLSMADLVRAHRLLHEDHSCCVCEDVAATSLCLTCGDLFCQACRKMHVKQSVTKHHRVEELSAITADQAAATFPTMCTVHPDKPAELFCRAHGVTVCHVCATSRHRGCVEVVEVEERVEGARGVLRGLLVRLTEGESCLDRALRQLDEHVTRTEKDGQATLQRLHDLRQRLDKAIAGWQQRVEGEAKGACCDVRESATEAKTCLLQRRGRLTSHKHVVQRVQDDKDGGTVSGMAPVMNSRVEELDCSAILPPNAKVISKVSVVIDQEAVTRIERELAGLAQVKVTPADLDAQLRPEKDELTFHENCGKNIVLSNGNHTAERRGPGNGDGIVAASQPMKTGRLYEVCLDKRDDINGYSLVTGVITALPDTLTLPIYIEQCSPAVVITGYCVRVNGKRNDSSVGKRLVNLPVKSRVGVLLDDTRCLHLYINGVDQGVAASHLPDTCFPVFDVYGPYRQVTALPVTCIK